MHNIWKCLIGKHLWGEIRITDLKIRHVREGGPMMISYNMEPVYEMRCKCCGRIKRGAKRLLKYEKGGKS